ncbi:hypothetical protein MHYP_G00081720 [Metynnis hypsauchen]
MRRILVAFNIKMSWKVYHKLAHSDKQEGGACSYVAAFISPIAVQGPTGHRVATDEDCMSQCSSEVKGDVLDQY